MSQYNVTVITVVYNGVISIESTIKSVINQSYSDFEYIIIDGGSKDGTIDIINKYKKNLTYFVSEKDSGIYDAMNKGISNSHGKWLIFMNSGDTFYNSNVLSNVFSKNYENVGVIYGSVNCYDKFKSVVIYPKSISALKNNMSFCHQSSFVKIELLQKNKFDTKYKIAADYNLYYNLYNQGIKFENCNMCIANYQVEGGLSSRNGYLGAKENLLINGKWMDNKHRILFYYKTLLFYTGFYLKKNLPKSILKTYFKYKYKK